MNFQAAFVGQVKIQNDDVGLLITDLLDPGNARVNHINTVAGAGELFEHTPGYQGRLTPNEQQSTNRILNRMF